MAETLKKWLRHEDRPGQFLRIVSKHVEQVRSYELYADIDDTYLGRLLFDVQGYWIYDGDGLTITEQEQLAGSIMLWNN